MWDDRVPSFHVGKEGIKLKLFAIADTHLSLRADKQMDVFHGWDNYVERLEENWRKLVSDDDIVVIPGDVSWEMDLADCMTDFAFLNGLPGQKILMKGNHDFWWATRQKMDAFLDQNGFHSIQILHNNAFQFGDYTLVGTRGWFYDAEKDADQKVLLREANRLRMSIAAGRALGGELICFLHYPPLTINQRCDEIINVLKEEEITRCYYGHLHGPSLSIAYNGTAEGIEFQLVSADYLHFCPYFIEKI